MESKEDVAATTGLVTRADEVNVVVNTLLLSSSVAMTPSSVFVGKAVGFYAVFVGVHFVLFVVTVCYGEKVHCSCEGVVEGDAGACRAVGLAVSPAVRFVSPSR